MFTRNAKTLTYKNSDNSQFKKYKFASIYFPPVDEIGEWDYFRKNFGDRQRSASKTIPMHAIMKSIGRKKEADFLANLISNSIGDVISRCPAACAKTAKNEEIRQFALRNRKAIIEHIFDEIHGPCLEMALNESHPRHLSIRYGFRRCTRQRAMDSLRKLTRAFVHHNLAASRAAAFLKLYRDKVESGDGNYTGDLPPEQISIVLNGLRSHIASEKLRQAYDHYLSGKALLESDIEQRNLRRNLSLATAMISAKIDLPFTREDFGALLIMSRQPDPTIAKLQ